MVVKEGITVKMAHQVALIVEILEVVEMAEIMEAIMEMTSAGILLIMVMGHRQRQIIEVRITHSNGGNENTSVNWGNDRGNSGD
nr:hypothetical protein PJ912_12405 [Pectobacterium colocasium]